MKHNGAGILFFRKTDQGILVQLAELHGSLIWDVPRGLGDESDENLWQTAVRHTTEALGGMPSSFNRRFAINLPLGFAGGQWKTFFVELSESPDFRTFPHFDHYEETAEFRRISWYAIDSLPKKTHWLLYLMIWRLWLSYRDQKSPRRASEPEQVLNRRRWGRAFRFRIRRAINSIFNSQNQ